MEYFFAEGKKISHAIIYCRFARQRKCWSWMILPHWGNNFPRKFRTTLSAPTMQSLAPKDAPLGMPARLRKIQGAHVALVCRTRVSPASQQRFDSFDITSLRCLHQNRLTFSFVAFGFTPATRSTLTIPARPSATAAAKGVLLASPNIRDEAISSDIEITSKPSAINRRTSSISPPHTASIIISSGEKNSSFQARMSGSLSSRAPRSSHSVHPGIWTRVRIRARIQKQFAHFKVIVAHGVKQRNALFAHFAISPLFGSAPALNNILAMPISHPLAAKTQGRDKIAI